MPAEDDVMREVLRRPGSAADEPTPVFRATLRESLADAWRTGTEPARPIDVVGTRSGATAARRRSAPWLVAAAAVAAAVAVIGFVALRGDTGPRRVVTGTSLTPDSTTSPTPVTPTTSTPTEVATTTPVTVTPDGLASLSVRVAGRLIGSFLGPISLDGAPVSPELAVASDRALYIIDQRDWGAIRLVEVVAPFDATTFPSAPSAPLPLPSATLALSAVIGPEGRLYVDLIDNSDFESAGVVAFDLTGPVATLVATSETKRPDGKVLQLMSTGVGYGDDVVLPYRSADNEFFGVPSFSDMPSGISTVALPTAPGTDQLWSFTVVDLPPLRDGIDPNRRLFPMASGDVVYVPAIDAAACASSCASTTDLAIRMRPDGTVSIVRLAASAGARPIGLVRDVLVMQTTSANPSFDTDGMVSLVLYDLAQEPAPDTIDPTSLALDLVTGAQLPALAPSGATTSVEVADSTKAVVDFDGAYFWIVDTAAGELIRVGIDGTERSRAPIAIVAPAEGTVASIQVGPAGVDVVYLDTYFNDGRYRLNAFRPVDPADPASPWKSVAEANMDEAAGQDYAGPVRGPTGFLLGDVVVMQYVDAPEGFSGFSPQAVSVTDGGSPGDIGVHSVAIEGIPQTWTVRLAEFNAPTAPPCLQCVVHAQTDGTVSWVGDLVDGNRYVARLRTDGSAEAWAPSDWNVATFSMSRVVLARFAGTTLELGLL